MEPDNNGHYSGKHHQLSETRCSPQPLRQPKVMIGGSGERKTLRLVARYGDACNLFAPSPEVVSHKLDVLRRHCHTEGRDFDEIRKTITAMSPDSSSAGRPVFVRDMHHYAQLGIDSVIVAPSSGRLRGSSRWRRLCHSWRSWGPDDRPAPAAMRTNRERSRRNGVTAQCLAAQGNRVPLGDRNGECRLCGAAAPIDPDE